MTSFDTRHQQELRPRRAPRLRHQVRPGARGGPGHPRAVGFLRGRRVRRRRRAQRLPRSRPSCTRSTTSASTSRWPGRSTCPARRQGQPVIFQAGVSEDGRNLAAHVAEGIYAPGGSLERGAGLLRRHQARGRPRSAAIPTTSSSSPAPARSWAAPTTRRPGSSRDIYEADNDFDRKLGFLGRAFGAYDFSQHDLDAPFPDVAHLAEKGGRTRGLELVQPGAGAGPGRSGRSSRRLPSTTRPRSPARRTRLPTRSADWYEAGAADGLNLRFRTDRGPAAVRR